MMLQLSPALFLLRIFSWGVVLARHQGGSPGRRDGALRQGPCRSCKAGRETRSGSTCQHVAQEFVRGRVSRQCLDARIHWGRRRFLRTVCTGTLPRVTQLSTPTLWVAGLAEEVSLQSIKKPANALQGSMPSSPRTQPKFETAVPSV